MCCKSGKYLEVLIEFYHRARGRAVEATPIVSTLTAIFRSIPSGKVEEAKRNKRSRRHQGVDASAKALARDCEQGRYCRWGLTIKHQLANSQRHTICCTDMTVAVDKDGLCWFRV